MVTLRRRRGRAVALALVAPVLLFALSRQSQVLIERFLASTLPAGAISHLNYAQKVAQIPMTLSLMLCTVTFPVVAQAIAEGDTERARDRVERDLALVAVRGAVRRGGDRRRARRRSSNSSSSGARSPRADTAATAAVMRVYALGLLGHTLVGALVRSYFSVEPAHLVPAGRDGRGHRRDLLDRRRGAVDSVGRLRHRRRQRGRDHASAPPCCCTGMGPPERSRSAPGGWWPS